MGPVSPASSGMDPKNGACSGHSRNLSGHLRKPTEVRAISRAYNVEVYSRAKDLTSDTESSGDNKRKMLEALDGDVLEEVVAEPLKAYGCDVILTRRSGERGKDSIVALPDTSRPLIAMVECKRHKDNHALGPLEPRALLGQFYFNNQMGIGLDCAMLVTNASRAGASALAFDQELSSFSLKTSEDVLAWISNYGKIKNGLCVPDSVGDLLL